MNTSPSNSNFSNGGFLGGLNTVDRLTGADAVSVIGEGQGVGAVSSGCKLSAFLPCEGISVIVIQRVAASSVYHTPKDMSRKNKMAQSHKMTVFCEIPNAACRV